MWRKKFGIAVAILSAAMAGPALSEKTAQLEAGLLTCEVGGGVALIISSPRDLHCVFHKPNGQNEAYRGALQGFGLDIGVSGRGVLAWTVLASTTRLPPGELKGTYAGVEAGAAAGIGGRGQILVGGSRRTVSLQPLSVEGEVGINIAVGVTSMTLRPLFRGRPRASAPRLPAVGYTYDDVPHERQTLHYGCGSYTHLQRGQTLYGVARTCGVTIESLLDVNPQIKNVRKIAEGALIHLPHHVGHHGSSPCGDRAVLQQNESLDHLAWRCGVTLHAVLRTNREIRDVASLEPGLVLKIPSRRRAVTEAPVVWAKTESDLPRAQLVSSRVSNDAVVAGTNFNATGQIPCARSASQPMAQCRFGVTRRGGRGNGWVKVFWPDGGNRVFFFEDGTPTSFDKSEADGNAKMSVGRNGDLFTVRVGGQRFEIPSAVITGG